MKNPYKSEELLWQALAMGVKEMVINTRDELVKIEKYEVIYISFKSRSSAFKNTSTAYFWAVEDYSENIQELHAVQEHVTGLYF